MADFSIQDAAFTGFRVVREHRGYLAVWAALSLAVSLVSTAAIVGIAGPDTMNLQALSASGSHDPATILLLLGRMAPLYLILMPAILVFNGVLYAAMNRAVLRPADRGFAYFALGADELRQIGLLFLGFFVFAAIYVLVVVALIVVIALIGTMTHAPPALFGLFVVLLAFGAMVWLAVRLSLASALTFESRRITLFGSWALTKGRFWPLLGAYSLVIALAGVIFLLTWLVILAVVAVATGGNLSAAFAPADLSSLGAYFTVANVVQLILSAGVSALLWPVVLTPPAAILRDVMAQGGSHNPAWGAT